MDIQDMRIFARVAAVQNLSAVGTELGLTPGTISKRIQALEDELCARLFDRTTRSIRITEEGAKFLTHVERILAEIEAARAAVGVNVEQPKGRLKISAPASFSRCFVGPAICAFMETYPEIEVQVDLTDRIVNLQEEGYDIAIRTGVLSDSAMIAKRLATDPQIIVASPRYVADFGALRGPEDLERRNCLVLCDQWNWSFTRNGVERVVRVGGLLRSNSIEILHHAALEGQGVMRTSELRVAEDLERGRLVRLLPEYDVTGKAAVWAVYPSAKHVLPRLRVLLDFLAEWFREQPAEAELAHANDVIASRVGADDVLQTRLAG